MIRGTSAQVARRMKGFTHDGSAHRDGIRNEHFVIEHLRRPTSTIGQRVCPAPHTIAHQGGTQSKADAVVSNGTTISIKHHKLKGTFDWINTSKHVPYELDVRHGLARVCDSFKAHQDVERARDEVSGVLSHTLTRLTNDDAWIRALLRRVHDEYPDALVVTVDHRKHLVMIPKQSLTQFLLDAPYSLKHKAGATSATIMTRVGDEWRSTSMRIRLVLNNGVNALLKLSSANRSSVPTIKIQQDDVDDWLETLEDTLTEAYLSDAVAPVESAAVPAEPIPAASAAPVEKIPAASAVPVEKIPAESAAPVEKIPAASAAPVEKIPAVPAAPVEPIAAAPEPVPAEWVSLRIPASPVVCDVAELSKQVARFVL